MDPVLCLPQSPRSTIPKFSAKNPVNVTLCQNYPSALEGLTLTEENAIAGCHPLGLIVNLRPGGRLSSISHRALRGHFQCHPPFWLFIHMRDKRFAMK
jgi:hypothetical protein